MTAKKCFVIAPIGEQGSDTRRRSDQVLRHIIRAALAPLGYLATRADEIAEPGLITSQVIQRVAEEDLVVADLTEYNPNVFYELALRHALRKPLIQLIARGARIPFDLAGMRTISFDHRDLDSVEEAKLEIAKQARHLETAGANVESPISVAIELQSLKQSDNPEQRSLADLLAAIADLRTSVGAIERRLSDSENLVTAVHPRHFIRSLVDSYDSVRYDGSDLLGAVQLDAVKQQEKIRAVEWELRKLSESLEDASLRKGKVKSSGGQAATSVTGAADVDGSSGLS
ncbi:MAG TPA: hypothetical protein VF017_04800 [Thermoanaerobaculia bacterium]|nr:hypothetical protein [Thermoanaerobaculia bacterium]